MLVLVAALAAMGPPAMHLRPVPPEMESTAVETILTVSREPRTGSGHDASFVRMTAQGGDEVSVFLIPFLRRHQPHPAVGATCTITYFRHIIEGAFGPNGETIFGGNILTSYRCGRDALVVTGR